MKSIVLIAVSVAAALVFAGSSWSATRPGDVYRPTDAYRHRPADAFARGNSWNGRPAQSSWNRIGY